MPAKSNREGLPFLHPASLISTCFGFGYLPYAPGTWGSLLALPLGWLLLSQWSSYILLIVAFILFLTGMIASDHHQKTHKDKDPNYIVIDELVGQLLVLSIVPLDWIYFFTAFILFRIFDIYKPWPISWADKRISNGFGIMFDDILAGGYAAAILYSIVVLMK